MYSRNYYFSRCAFSTAVFVAFLSSSAGQAGEIIQFKSWAGNQLKEQEVIAELHLPTGSTTRLPVIITQHGSTQDKPFKSGKGKTDVYSQQIIDKGLAQGFAVVAIDAFYPRNTKATDKQQFPAAQFYALTLKNMLASDNRFDPDRIFYTGFSYGGQMVIVGGVNYLGRSASIILAGEARSL